MTFKEWWKDNKKQFGSYATLPFRIVGRFSWDAATAQSAAEIEVLRAEVERLKAENEALCQKLAQHADGMLWLADPTIEYGKVTALKQ